ncbi:MAG: PspC domain-containing protein [Bacteroidetes bacterium]|nr:PspC domain-containing protein [Bacteroidota bacterium]
MLRSRNTKVIGGVFGGLGSYFEVDAIILGLPFLLCF